MTTVHSLSYLYQIFRIKKLDWYVLKSYVGPFLVTFFVAWFVVIMQFLWKYIDDMIGKGLSYDIIIKFVYYTSLTLVPMSLPIAVLLSSIMTMGRFGEHFELTAAKASGVSVFKFFRSLIIFSILLCFFAFYFANYVLTEVKNVADNMLEDVRNLKPTLVLKPKTFYNGISGATIRVEGKNEATGDLYDIKIYNHAEGRGNENILIAKKGTMVQSHDGNVLILKLDSGVRYTEVASNSYDNPQFPFYQVSFKRYEKRFDLRQFKLGQNFGKTGEDRRHMLTTFQLQSEIDSFRQIEVKNLHKLDTFAQNMPWNRALANTNVQQKLDIEQLYRDLPTDKRLLVNQAALNSVQNDKNTIFVPHADALHYSTLSTYYRVEWHFKYTFALSSLILFFVGGPLGAIIKKGGIGWPMLISVVLFILYFFSNVIFRKVCEKDALDPIIGMWIPTAVFGLMGFILTIKATNDSSILDAEIYNSFFDKISQKMRFRSKKVDTYESK